MRHKTATPLVRIKTIVSLTPAEDAAIRHYLTDNPQFTYTTVVTLAIKDWVKKQPVAPSDPRAQANAVPDAAKPVQAKQPPKSTGLTPEENKIYKLKKEKYGIHLDVTQHKAASPYKYAVCASCDDSILGQISKNLPDDQLGRAINDLILAWEKRKGIDTRRYDDPEQYLQEIMPEKWYYDSATSTLNIWNDGDYIQGSLMPQEAIDYILERHG